MIFIPKILQGEEQILATIFNALANKFESWSNKTKNSASKEKTRYTSTPTGMTEVKQKIHPYGPLKQQIKAVNDAAATLRSAAYKFKYMKRRL